MNHQDAMELLDKMNSMNARLIAKLERRTRLLLEAIVHVPLALAMAIKEELKRDNS